MSRPINAPTATVHRLFIPAHLSLLKVISNPIHRLAIHRLQVVANLRNGIETIIEQAGDLGTAAGPVLPVRLQLFMPKGLEV
jgi:hypothetical protein